MKHLLLKLFILIICLSTGLVVFAQSKDSKGKDFWLVFNGNLGTPTITIFITSQSNTSGTVTVPGLAFSTPFTVTANTVTPITVPNSVASHTSDVVDNKGVHVTAIDEVTVYGLNYIPYTTDAFLGLPTDALGTDYIVMSYTGAGVSEFGLVGTVNGTTVTITPSTGAGAHAAGVPFTLMLNQGQTYELVSGNDLTGTLISATNPVGLTGGNSCANIPPGYAYCDHIVEMMTSTDTWGKKFATVPLKDRTNGDTWRFLASQNNTTVSINGVAQAPINKGQYIERALTAQSIIESDKPIMVAQFSNGSTFSSNPGDPFMMLIPPLEQFLANYTVTTVSGYVSHYINVVAPNALVGSVTLDGAPIPSASFTAIGASGFSGAQLTVAAGSHTLNGTLPFGVFMYGFNNDDSYGYPGGQSFAPIAIVSSISISPTSGSGQINNQQCFDATVKDQNNNPLQGIRVDFNITGPNIASSGFAFTDVNGIAHFCYTGTNAGTDNITASVGTLNAGASFTWNAGCNITISVKKFYDLNTDGMDNDNIPVANWQFTLTGTDENNQAVGPVTQTTDMNGIAAFTGLANGNYTIAEVLSGTWINTTAASANVTVSGCTNPTQVKIGNVCIGGGGNGGGIGYWRNKNGQALITGAYLCALNALCLRDASGNDFDPVQGCPAPTNNQVSAGKTNLANWLQNANAVNMSYMMSAQFAALKLNVLSGKVDASKLVYAPGTSSANAAGFATISSLMNEANAILCSNGIIAAGNPLRTRAEAVKNALEGANENTNFVQPLPCNSFSTTQKAQPASIELTRINSFTIKASPNPSRSFFNISLKGNGSNEKMHIRVVDLLGRIIEEKISVTDGTLSIGEHYNAGVYILEVQQGNDRQMIKLVKAN
jgi:hypothetical protein